MRRKGLEKKSAESSWLISYKVFTSSASSKPFGKCPSLKPVEWACSTSSGKIPSQRLKATNWSMRAEA